MYVIDVEASGLDIQSYPIQIGWQHRGDARKFGEILIEPHFDWNYWDPAAESIHKIPRSSLAKGMLIDDACHLLNEVFGNSVVYSDAYQADGFWIERLFSTAGIDQKFKIGSVFDLIDAEKQSEFTKCLRRQARPHRALADARIISDTVNYFAEY